MDERELLKKRFLELGKKAYNMGIFLFTDFLGLGEQAIFAEVEKEISYAGYTAFGGTEGAERVMIRFGRAEDAGYEQPFPISCIRIEPLMQKFADKLTHRDFLGAIMNLGIERATLGDIAIRDNVGYLFLKEDIAPYILSELTRVKHTDVRTALIDSPPTGELYKTEMRRVQANGERVDALIAKLFSLSRIDAQSLFPKGLVFANGKAVNSPSYVPKYGEIISVRGVGRFIFRGYGSTSKKGKLNIDLELYV